MKTKQHAFKLWPRRAQATNHTPEPMNTPLNDIYTDIFQIDQYLKLHFTSNDKHGKTEIKICTKDIQLQTMTKVLTKKCLEE